MELKEYIKINMEKGYSAQQVKDFLVSKGYNSNDIDNAISQINTSTNQTQNIQQTSQEQNPQQTTQENYNQQSNSQIVQSNQLDNYILGSLKQGYQPKQIYDSLIVQGYEEKIILDSFKRLDKNEYEGKMPFDLIHKHSSKLVVMILILILVVGGALGGYYFMQKFAIGSSQTPTIASNSLSMIVNAQSEVILGENIEINIQTNAQGDSSNVNYEFVFRNNNNVLVSSETETKSKTTSSFKKSILIPENIPLGSYKIEIKATFGNKVETKQINFNVVDKNTEIVEPSQTQPPIEEKPVEITQPTQPTSTQPTINKKLSDSQIYSLAYESLSKSEAIGYCEKINYIILKEDCFTSIAQKFNDEGICLYIEENKDHCYMNMVINGREELCSLVIDDSSKTICLHYQNLQNIDFNQTYTPKTVKIPENSTDINDYDANDFFN